MRIFLSHASEQMDSARGVEVALRAEGHSVFFDRSVLQSGETYNDQIRAAIAESDLFVFLISPEALGKGRYTLTELELAEERWPRPSGHLLPVMVRPVEHGLIPPYLRGVTILDPDGDIPAAVAAAVARLSTPWWWPLLRKLATVLVVGAALSVGLAAWWGYQHWRTARDVSTLLDTGRLQQGSGDYATAWDTLARAGSLAPRRPDVVLAREQLAMDWLDNVRVTVGQGTFTAIVEKVQTVLARCAVSSAARRAADCLAHLGWGDFLRAREGVGGLDPVQSYRRALAVDPSNVYAHTMWGFDILRSGGALDEARAHLAKALAAGRERAYVRHLEISGLLWRHDAESEDEAIRVANDIRAGGDAMPGSESAIWRLWSVYYDRLINRHRTEGFLAVLPAADHLATFRWLFPEDRIPPDKCTLYLFMLATFEEHAGERAGALAIYRKLHDSLAREGARAFGGPVPERTAEAIERLSRPR